MKKWLNVKKKKYLNDHSLKINDNLLYIIHITF